MAASISLLESDLSCSICCDIFREPVVLRCCHSFCKACLDRYWAQGDPGQRQCPLCRRVAPLMEEPVLNLTLKNLCDTYLSGSQEKDGGQPGLSGGTQCPLHGEPFKLFCLVDKVPVCVVCHSSKMHKNHECSPIGEAGLECKVMLQAALEALQGKLESTEKMKQTYKKESLHVKDQVLHTEMLIKAEFGRLHAFLQDEEEARLAALKKEGEEKTLRLKEQMAEMTRSILSLSQTITAIEEDLRAEELTILHNYKTTEKRAQYTTQVPEMSSGGLVNVAAHLDSLKYRVWEKMLQIVQYNPVTLDPNTAAPWLVLSEDLTGVLEGNERQNLPDNLERFHQDAAVLGARGIRSGSHWWDVEVGDSSAWVVGVAKESVQRKENLSSVLKNGYLTVFFYEDMYFAGTSPLTRLVLKKQPRVVRVELNWDRGRISFSEPNDKAHIYTFKHTFTEEVFPYLWVGCKRCPLRILPVPVSVRVAQASGQKSWF